MPMPGDEHGELRQRYEQIALTKDEHTTACDFHLRDLEIAFAMECLRDGDVVLDMGCGPGLDSNAGVALSNAQGSSSNHVDPQAHRRRPKPDKVWWRDRQADLPKKPKQWRGASPFRYSAGLEIEHDAFLLTLFGF
jgi:hypothetical protein